MHGWISFDDGQAEADGTLYVPDVLPIFPLPRTVLLPGEILPLHVFEPRYRQLVADVLSSNRVFGIVDLDPGFDGDLLSDASPVRDVGCVGFIAQHEVLADGRILLWLVGVERFRIDEELEVSTPYRQVRVTYTPVTESPQALAGIRSLRQELRVMLPSLVADDDETQASMHDQILEVTDTQLVALASQILELTSSRKQELLEAGTLTDRFLMLYEDLYAHLERHPDLDDIDPGVIN